ncbi:hypothetical protein [Paenibacillus marinisediminis]
MAEMSRTEQIERAVQYMKTKARPLERALYEWEYESGSAERVVEELAKFQNRDGGFGHGLEPDIRMASSSIIATTVALQIMSYMKLSAEHKLIQDAMTYVLDQYDTGRQGWEIVPHAVSSAPHAPWWTYRELHNGWGNPNLELVGYLYEFPYGPLEFREKITEHAVSYMTEESPLDDFHELLCALRMAKRVPSEVLEQMRAQLDDMVHRCVKTDPAEWLQYSLTPLEVVKGTNSPYYEKYKDSITANIKHLLAQQQEDGAWHPVWSWGQFEEAWQQAKEEWKGIITLNTLRDLNTFSVS